MDDLTLEITKERILEAFRKCHNFEMALASCGLDTTDESNITILERIAQDSLFQIRLRQLRANFKIDLHTKLRDLMEDKNKSIALSATNQLSKLYLQDLLNTGQGAESGAIPTPSAEHIPKKINVVSVAPGTNHPTKDQDVDKSVIGEVEKSPSEEKDPEETTSSSDPEEKDPYDSVTDSLI